MTKEIQNEIDGICETVELLIKNGRWELLDKLFLCWGGMAWRTDVNILISCATASLPAKNEIPSRVGFINTCKKLYPDIEFWND